MSGDDALFSSIIKCSYGNESKEELILKVNEDLGGAPPRCGSVHCFYRFLHSDGSLRRNSLGILKRAVDTGAIPQIQEKPIGELIVSYGEFRKRKRLLDYSNTASSMFSMPDNLPLM